MPRLMSLVPWLAACAALVISGGAIGRTVQPVRVAGASMSPALEPGDVVLVARRSPVGLRDIVLVREPGHRAVLHRIVARAANGDWVTQGDANPIPDLASVPRSAIAGRVIRVVRTGGVTNEWREVLGGAKLANQSNSTRR